MAIIIGDRVVQTGDSGYQPQGIFGVASNQGGGPAGMTFGEAASVKIPTIYEYTGTGDDGRGKLVVKETRPGIMSEQEAQQAQAIIDKNQPATAGGLTAEQLRQPKTGIFGIDTSNLGLPTINPALGAIQGFQNTNQVLEKLSKGSKLNPNDKITLINLRNNLDADTRTNLFLKYSRDNKVKLNDLISNFQTEYGKIVDKVTDPEKGDFPDYSDAYFKRMDEMGLGDTIKTMVGDLTGTRDTKGVITLEAVTDSLGPEGLAYLKATDPQTYYRLRPNDRDLANESFVSTGDRVADRRFNAKIMEARAEAMDRQSRQDANMGQGIMAASPALPGISVPAGGTVSSSTVTPNPVLTPVPVGSITPTTTTGITPFNINQFYASLPQYVQQGIMTPTNLSRFTNALRMFPGATA
jgi:hypothetical protein